MIRSRVLRATWGLAVPDFWLAKFRIVLLFAGRAVIRPPAPARIVRLFLRRPIIIG
jgi:hypothetical protein